MRIFTNLEKGLHELISAVAERGEPLSYSLSGIFSKNRQWGKRDRDFLWESSFIFFKNYRLISAVLHQDEISPGHLPSTLADAYIQLLKSHGSFAELSAQLELAAESFPDMIKFSIPEEWKDFEYDSQKLIESVKQMRSKAPLCLRVNRLKIKPEQVVQQLRTDHISAELLPPFPDAVVIQGYPKLDQHPLIAEGYGEVQDAGSQEIAVFCMVEPEMKVLDACCGAGGKSLHIASLMSNKGTLVCGDVSGHKLKELVMRSRRAGVKIAQTVNWSEQADFKKDYFHRVLIDAPCSGSGTLKREPDLRLRISTNTLNKTISLQRELMSRYAEAVAVGGHLIYATCSIFTAENEIQTEWFLEQHPHFKMEAIKSILPTAQNDGFFMARMKREK